MIGPSSDPIKPPRSSDSGAGDRGWVGPGAEGLIAALGAGPGLSPLEAAFAAEGGVALRRMPGRDTTLLELAGRRVVLKRGWGANTSELLREFLRGGPLRSPSRREAESLAALRAAGVVAPAPLAWFEERGARRPGGGRSALLMELVEHRETLRGRLSRSDRSERRRLLARLLALVVRLHSSGFYHRDLYVHHVVLALNDAGVEELVLLDAGRVRQRGRPRRRWLVKDLGALDASAPDGVSERERLRFLSRWLEGTGRGDRGDLLAWARDARRKAARIRAHAPRHSDPAAPEVPPTAAEGAS